LAGIALLLLLATTAAAHWSGQRRSLVLAQGSRLHSRPAYHGAYVAIWSTTPALLLLILGLWLEPHILASAVRGGLPDAIRALPEAEIRAFLADAATLASDGVPTGTATPALEQAAADWARSVALTHAGLSLGVGAAAIGGLFWSRSRIAPGFRARNAVERMVEGALAASSLVAILVTVGIVLSLVFEAVRFFSVVPPGDFLFGTQWSPQTAIRADQVGSSGAFGAVPVFAGTLLITVVAMSVAVPIGLLSAIHLSEYASPSLRAWAKPTLEVLAGVPTVVYGFFAALTVGPMVRGFGTALGLDVASESALAAGLIMGVMIIPFVSSLSDDVINAVPQTLRDGSFGLGATPSETIRRVVLPAALPGIASAVLLATSRAIGETMIVVMAAGMSAKLTANPLEAVTTVTVQINALLTGDQEFDSAKTLAAFALGLALFLVTLLFNVVAHVLVRRYREQYD